MVKQLSQPASPCSILHSKNCAHLAVSCCATHAILSSLALAISTDSYVLPSTLCVLHEFISSDKATAIAITTTAMIDPMCFFISLSFWFKKKTTSLLSGAPFLHHNKPPYRRVRPHRKKCGILLSTLISTIRK